MSETPINTDVNIFGKVWGTIYLLALIHIFYFGGFKHCTVERCTESTYITADNNPIFFYPVVLFLIINVMIGIYLGFIFKCDSEEEIKEETIKEKFNNF